MLQKALSVLLVCLFFIMTEKNAFCAISLVDFFKTVSCVGLCRGKECLPAICYNNLLINKVVSVYEKGNDLLYPSSTKAAKRTGFDQNESKL